MPELPEVETIVRELGPHLRERRILDVDVDWARTIASKVALQESLLRTEARRFARYVKDLKPLYESIREE